MYEIPSLGIPFNIIKVHFGATVMEYNKNLAPELLLSSALRNFQLTT